MRCENCGKEVPEGKAVCPDCGAVIMPRPAADPQDGRDAPDSRKWNKDKLSVVLGIVGIAAFCAMPFTAFAATFDLYFLGVGASLLSPFGPFACAFGMSFALREKKYKPGIVLNFIGLALYAAFFLLAIYALTTD